LRALLFEGVLNLRFVRLLWLCRTRSARLCLKSTAAF
jgi:hypothetical protein